jgi:ubiquinone/menaquinone biosynthesis C-methylase UbiE
MERQNFSAHYPASLYDSFSQRFLDIYDTWVMRRLAQLCRNAPPGSAFLDVGTGTARLLLKMAAQKPFDPLRLIGADYFAEMTAIAGKNVAEAGLDEKIKIIQADAHSLPFLTGRVRYVFSRSTVHHWQDPVRALREIHRVLEPGGAAMIYEINREASPEAMARFNEVRRSAEVEASRRDEKYTPDEVWQFVKSAGLDTVSELLAPKMGMMSLGMELIINK